MTESVQFVSLYKSKARVKEKQIEAMKQKMILYAYAQNEGINPTQEQISQKEKEILEEYANLYISMGKDEETARLKAQEVLDAEGGAFYAYEKLIQEQISKKIENETKYE